MTASTDVLTGGTSPRPSPRGLSRTVERARSAILREPLAWATLATDLLLIAGFGLASDGIFVSTASLQALGINSAQVILLAIAAAIVLGLGEIDISLGANLVGASVVSGTVVATMSPDSPAGTVILVGLLVGILTSVFVGALNAFSILVLKVNSFITGLATLGVLTGFVYIFTGGSNVVGIPQSLQDGFGSATLALVPAPVWLAVGASIIVWYVVRRTRLGLHLLACGSARDAASRAGVRTARTLLLTFLIDGALCGAAGFIDLSRFGTTDITGHQSDALAAIAGAVIGGTRLSGGRISILGAVSGALLASILQTGLIVLGLPSFYQLVVIGLVLVTAVAIGQRRDAARP
jgi:ribose transport system permease protein